MTNDQLSAVHAAIDSLRTMGRRSDAEAVVALLRAHNRMAGQMGEALRLAAHRSEAASADFLNGILRRK